MRFRAHSRCVAYTDDFDWKTEWCVYDNNRRICTATSERQARKIAKALNLLEED